MSVKFRTVIACRDTLAAGYVETPFRRSQKSDAVPDSDPALATVRASRHYWRERCDMIADPISEIDLGIVAAHRGYGIVMPIGVASMSILRSRLINRAWRDGAWDMTEHHYPPINGDSLGVVSANRRWLDAERERLDADAPRASLERWLSDAAVAGSLVVWSWRPMVDNPYLSYWLPKDRSLAPDGSRGGDAPLLKRPETGGSYHYVFGKRQKQMASQKGGRRAGQRGAPPATRRQLEYLADLMRRANRHPADIPKGLTRQQASSMIDIMLLANS